MLKKLLLMFRVPDLRRKLFFVALILVVFRVAAAIPIPGVDPIRLKAFLASSQFFGLLNVFSGGVLDQLSVAMLGVGPYITASIIMQLATMIVPRLKEMYQEEGEAGRARFNFYSRFLTVPLAFLQGYGLLVLLVRQQVIAPLSPFGYFSNLMVVVAGTMFLMWLGELITEQGIGNGVSLLILAGIVARLPRDIQQEFFTFTPDKIPGMIGFLLVSVAVIAGVVVISEGERAVPVSYAKRIRGNRVFGGTSTHLPLRVNQAGVIPIIFAVSVILFPGLVGSFLSGVPNPYVQRAAAFLVALFNNSWFYGSAYFFMVFIFTYFYTAITFDPQQISENLQKQGGFILGIRPGAPTAHYLARILTRITLAGALFLGVIAILPLIVESIFSVRTISIGGTALLIVVSVVIETMKQVDAQLVMREYDRV